MSADPGATAGTKFELTGGVEIEIVSQNSTSPLGIKVTKRGKGFKPSDFATKHIVGTAPSTTEYFGVSMNFGSGGRIIFRTGKVYQTIEYDPGPKEHTEEPVMLTPPSQRGKAGTKEQGNVDATKITNISLGNKSTGQYDAFYYFHNDILHTTIYPGAFSPGYAQYVLLTVG